MNRRAFTKLTLTDEYQVDLHMRCSYRIVAMETRTGVSPALHFEYQYDYLGHRFQKQQQTPAGGGGWQVHPTVRYTYDGWNMIDETSSSDSVRKEYVWGLDLSGSMQGAGSAGSMLMCNYSTDSAATYTAAYPTYDGNGNISELLSSGGASLAHYKYDAFGRAVINTGGTTWNSESNMVGYRSSTKPVDTDTDLYYYGYRYYDPNVGRWISRDPIAELGGYNLYNIVDNDVVNFYDYLGKMGSKPKVKQTKILYTTGTDLEGDECDIYQTSQQRFYGVVEGERGGRLNNRTPSKLALWHYEVKWECYQCECFDLEKWNSKNIWEKIGEGEEALHVPTPGGGLPMGDETISLQPESALIKAGKAQLERIKKANCPRAK